MSLKVFKGVLRLLHAHHIRFVGFCWGVSPIMGLTKHNPTISHDDSLSPEYPHHCWLYHIYIIIFFIRIGQKSPYVAKKWCKGETMWCPLTRTALLLKQSLALALRG